MIHLSEIFFPNSQKLNILTGDGQRAAVVALLAAGVALGAVGTRIVLLEGVIEGAGHAH